ncbi:MAG TPA: tetratricopeptide repeat protein [Vicinamibacterales bacterium]|nr:tetratricopeptide repeat protein [Vicinamibacterales bacterium]
MPAPVCGRALAAIMLACAASATSCGAGAVGCGGSWHPHDERPRREELKTVPGAVAYQDPQAAAVPMFEQAKALLARRDYPAAERLYRRILDIQQNSPDAHVGVATCRLLQRDLAGAERHYARALVLDPRSVAASIGLGSVAHERRDHAAAEKFYRQALAIDDENADAHRGLAMACDVLGRTDEASEHYAAFLRLAPESEYANAVRTRMVELGLKEQR